MTVLVIALAAYFAAVSVASASEVVLTAPARKLCGRFWIENVPTTSPTTVLPPTLPVGRTSVALVPVLKPFPLEATQIARFKPVVLANGAVSETPAVIGVPLDPPTALTTPDARFVSHTA